MATAPVLDTRLAFDVLERLAASAIRAIRPDVQPRSAVERLGISTEEVERLCDLAVEVSGKLRAARDHEPLPVPVDFHHPSAPQERIEELRTRVHGIAERFEAHVPEITRLAALADTIVGITRDSLATTINPELRVSVQRAYDAARRFRRLVDENRELAMDVADRMGINVALVEQGEPRDAEEVFAELGWK